MFLKEIFWRIAGEKMWIIPKMPDFAAIKKLEKN